MEIANADNTTEFAGQSTSRSSRNLREVDLNETPAMRDKRLQSRVDALTRTGTFRLVTAPIKFHSFSGHNHRYCILSSIICLLKILLMIRWLKIEENFHSIGCYFIG